MDTPIDIRTAVPADVARLRELLERSVRGLQMHDYSPQQIERALVSVYGIDSQLVADGSYFVAQTADGATIAGCGGWSRRPTLYGGDQFGQRSDEWLDPLRDAAKIRAFFVDPAWARRGIASRILATCEDAARAAGFLRFEIGATLTGAALFTARGYRVTSQVAIPLGDGITLPIVLLEKTVTIKSGR